jgi:hypothetical protein
MYPPSSTPSTTSLEISSAGQSRSGFETLFDRLHWRASWPTTVGSQPAFFEATIGDESGLFFWASEPKEDTKKRILGCALLLSLPVKGLDEALESLWEVREFHIGAITAGFSPGELVTERGVGKSVASQDRPPFIFQD